MKKTLLFAGLAVSMFASGATVILYDDGTQYTVDDNEYVYVSNYRKLYHQKRYSRGDVLFHLTLPNTKRDVEYVENPNPIGSHEWCEAHELFANGYTFDDQAWLRSCDVNGDMSYDICDWYEPTGVPTFEELEWQDKCNNGESSSGD